MPKLLNEHSKRALDALDEAEKAFLLSCGWTKNRVGWVHRLLCGGKPTSVRSAVHATRLSLVRESLIERGLQSG